MRTARPRASGFTLVELMMVVAIIGILSSVAVPQFRNFQYRSKQTERSIVTTALHRTIEDYYMREGRYPTNWGGGMSGLNLQANPDWAPTTSKRPWRTADWGDDWRKLPFMIDGSVYYSYYGWGQTVGNQRQILIWTFGDLDGNGVWDEVQKEWIYDGFVLQKWVGGGPNACDDCTWQWTWGTGF